MQETTDGSGLENVPLILSPLSYGILVFVLELNSVLDSGSSGGEQLASAH